MAFQWSGRQFVAGAICLDLANTVICPPDPDRRSDRLKSPADLEDWIGCALDHAALDAEEREALAAAPRGGSRADLNRARALRDAVDRLFRPVAAGAAPDPAALKRIASAYREACEGALLRPAEAGLRLTPGRGPGRISSLIALTAQSALALAFSPELRRIKACPSCDWLFIDRSNSSRRLWCDMQSCGNRAKAKRHYERRRRL